jgi:outer membrane protein assembly factor BamB
MLFIRQTPQFGLIFITLYKTLARINKNALHFILLLMLSALFGCRQPDTVPPPGTGTPFDTLNFEWHVKKPWSVGQSSISELRPTIFNDSQIIFGFGEGFVCLNANTGATIWQDSIGINPGAYPKSWFALDMIIENGKIYTLAGNDAIRGSKASAVCLSVANGSLIWHHDLAQNDYFAWQWNKYSASPNAIYYATQAGHVVALSKADGSVLWDSPNGSDSIPALLQSSPIYRNGVVYVCSALGVTLNGIYRQGVVMALDANTGNVLWNKIIPGPDSTIIGYSNWKLLNNNQMQAPAVPVPSGIIIEPGYCVALMDTTGHLLWRSAPSINGGVSPYIWQPFLFNGSLYGYNSGNPNFFAYDINVGTGAVNWVQSASQNSCVFYPPCIDSSGSLYEVTDDLSSSLWGQYLINGSKFLYTPLVWYMNSSDDAFASEYLVQGKRVYFQTQNEIICIARK